MKTIVLKVLEFAKVILPFFVKTNKKDSKEFSDLIKGQYEFLVAQLEKVLKDYFETSEKVREMHTELFALKTQLAAALGVGLDSEHAVALAHQPVDDAARAAERDDLHRLGAHQPLQGRLR